MCCLRFVCQAEDGIRDLVRSRGLGDVYKRQVVTHAGASNAGAFDVVLSDPIPAGFNVTSGPTNTCLLYTSDAADERSSVDLGGRRIIKQKKQVE